MDITVSLQDLQVPNMFHFNWAQTSYFIGLNSKKSIHDIVKLTFEWGQLNWKVVITHADCR